MADAMHRHQAKENQTMQPIIELVPRSITVPARAFTVREHVEAHRANLVFEAIRDAASRIACSTDGLDVFEQLVATSDEAAFGDKVRDAFERMNRALWGAVSVFDDNDGLRLVVGNVVVTADATGWLIVGTRRCI
jgi:hypothetical protein